MRRVIELIRVSTEAQAGSDRASIPAQRAVNQRTARTYGLQVVKTIEIIDVSGAAVLLSPGMQELVKLIDDPEIHGVVAREFSRLMRPEKLGDFILLQSFADTGTHLYLPDGPIDFDSKSGRLLGGIKALVAGLERSEILERMWSAKESKRRTGGFSQSWICLPYGVNFVDNNWSYTPDAENVREAFRLLLGGELSYCEIGRQVGIEPYNLRLILRNPIYTGVRVIDKRRDTSARGRRTKADGKQGDRPKIRRAPEDVIRIKVIDAPLVSESEFLKAQQLMDAKKKNHWRAQTRYTHRFTYNGFLTCGLCGQLVYTAWRRDDYYICKARSKGCGSHSMRRDIIDPSLDSMFATKFTDPAWRDKIAESWRDHPSSGNVGERRKRLEAQFPALQAKRSRILDAYVDGALDRGERDRRLAVIDAEMSRVSGLILRDDPQPTLTVQALAGILDVFVGWSTLNREQKRRILSLTVPEIKVANYRIEGIYLFGRSNEVNHTDKAYLAAPQYIPLGIELRP